MIAIAGILGRMRVFALLVALVVGTSPAAFEICQIACASSAAAPAAMAATPSCHHGHATMPASTAHGSRTSVTPHSGECAHGDGALVSPGLAAARRAAVNVAPALHGTVALLPELSARHLRPFDSRISLELVRIPHAIPLRL